jgi:hypothetical protein
MTTESAIKEIAGFWNDDQELSFGKVDNTLHTERIEAEFGITLQDMLSDYIKNFAPSEDFYFETVGNPIRVYGIDNLKFKQDGYTFNPVQKKDIEDWNRNLFILADEGADPVVIDLKNTSDGIIKLSHGQGNWERGETVANTIGQFLLCSAALHHALTGFEEEAIVDDEKGFNLAPAAAKWYFTNMKKWAGGYYEEWCSVFDNH